jgi:hypothetical protein
MTPRHLLRSLARVLPLLVPLLAAPNAAPGWPAASGSSELAPKARARLAQAAVDSRVAPWQRDLMLCLARTGTTSTLDPSAADRRATLPALASGAADGVWNQPLGPTRHSHSAIYDPVRDRMVVFGGSNSSGYLNDVWALSLAGTPAWAQLTPSGTQPGARLRHGAIYDPVRDRMMVFGGSSGGSSYLNDVWALSLAGTPAWTQLIPSAGPGPTTKCPHGAIYDPVRDCMVVSGGWAGDATNDVWALSLVGTPVWTRLTSPYYPPYLNTEHSAVYDPVRDRMVVFGGNDGHLGYGYEVWALSLAGGWTQLDPPGPRPGGRRWHSAIYDPVRERMVVFGGYSGSILNDVWTLSLASTPAWTQLNPSGMPPSARSYHSAIHDPVRDRMVVFGGTSSGPFNDVWVLLLADNPVWTKLTPSGAPPIARWGHSAIYDPVRDRMLFFGGARSSYLGDVWALSLTGTPAWTELTPSGTPPSARYGHSAIYDPVRDRMVVFGGGNSLGYLNDVWALSLAGTPAWTELTPSATPPSARWGHSAIRDPVRDCMVVFGGSGPLNDVWALSLAGTPAWAQLTPSGTQPGARDWHSAVYDPVRDRIVVFGGDNGAGPLNDVWALMLAGTPAWMQLTPSGTPPGARYWHSAIYDPARDHMVVFGGRNSSDHLDEVWELAWSPTVAVNDPPARPLVSGLRPPAPNPARGTTAVSYAIAQAGRVQLGVYDVSGRLVRQLVDGERRAGAETVVWNGMDESGARMGAGVYFVRLAAPGLCETRRVILLK